MKAISLFVRTGVISGLLAILLLPGACTKPDTKAQQITVAAAANLTEAFEEIGRQFTAKTGIQVIYSYGSTADLGKQIENGAPFDAFAAADVEHIDELNGKGLIIPETRALYARGRLVLWIPPTSKAIVSRIEDIVKTEIKTVAIAKPELAPYGKASVETLQALQIWSQVEAKVVYGSNVSQTRQFASTGNADVAFIPLSFVKPGEGRYIEVEEKLHQPINQALAVIKATKKQDAARHFSEYVMSQEGQEILAKFGYMKSAGIFR